ncbi:Protein of uncharacterised function (DUF3793) [uncultured Clostridium sp.]|uniref:DUF3793 family protein n=1 Tax=uncultured Clostridium sp. TaxID=59620 RepID=UPI00082214CA|nr:DUF3793 family protein [uncultured Clostridium sp.]SCJ97686.1 Protein of uncharacterised function (DUF3793) [uncultured Clostridium sp.]
MSTIGFYKSLDKMEERECIEKFLIYNASLVVTKAKPSATITLKKGHDSIYEKWVKYGEDFLKSIDIGYINLRECENALIILIYDEGKLANYIFKKESKSFLKKLGYTNENNLNAYLKVLKRRYEEFNCPHELGVFLGYPLDDVRDFMECSNKKCLACGYWRVYNDYNTAKEVFNTYDMIKQKAVSFILKGDSSQNVLCNLKNIINKAESIAV